MGTRITDDLRRVRASEVLVRARSSSAAADGIFTAEDEAPAGVLERGIPAACAPDGAGGDRGDELVGVRLADNRSNPDEVGRCCRSFLVRPSGPGTSSCWEWLSPPLGPTPTVRSR
jgi:hypothetical protein